MLDERAVQPDGGGRGALEGLYRYQIFRKGLPEYQRCQQISDRTRDRLVPGELRSEEAPGGRERVGASWSRPSGRSVSGPQLPQLCWQDVFDILDLSFRDTSCQHREYRAGDLGRGSRGTATNIVAEFPTDPHQKLLLVALSQGLAGRIPPFVVEATDQHRKLRPQLSHFLHG